MSKRKKTPKKKQDSVPLSKKPNPEKAVEKDEDDANPFDFGGLPNRDLKKNLGCG